MPQNILAPAGPAAQRIADLGWLILIVFIAVTVAVWLLLAWIAVRRRGSLDEHLPVDAGGGQAWIVIGGVVVPVIVLSGLYLTSLVTLAQFPIQDSAGDVLRLRVTGQQWWFSAEYLAPDRPGALIRVPTEIHIPVGRPVDIELASRDVIHSFWVPRLHGKVDLVPGVTNRIRLVADRPGVFAGECAEFCGLQHAHMRLQIVAQAPADFERWLAHQQAPAREPHDARARQGRELFMNGPCPVCHTVRGTDALASVGPDLTHVASRSRIAGGMLENNTANLMAWVVHAQSIKPGSGMPDVTRYSGTELHALVHYLQSLE